MKREILVGDVREQLGTLPDASVDVVCTSPPYWALRDYGVPGQLGLEPSWREHMQNLRAVFAEVHRVLKPTGNLWVNYGDTVATGAGKSKNSGGSATNSDNAWRRRGTEGGQPSNAPNDSGRSMDPRKHKLGLAWRLRFMLNDELGFISRSDIVWHKPNSMPLSMKDRMTPKYEMLFHLTKRPTYFFDLDAIRKPFSEATEQRVAQATFDQQTGGPKDYGNGMSSRGVAQGLRAKMRSDNTWEARRGQSVDGKGPAGGQKPHSTQRAGKFNVRVRDAPLGVSDMKWGALAGATPDEVAAYDERPVAPRREKTLDAPEHAPAREQHLRLPPEVGEQGGPDENGQYNDLGANPGDVWWLDEDEEEDAVGSETWTIPNQPFAGAHFATYPEELVRRVLLASCPAAVCTKCGEARRNVYESTVIEQRGSAQADMPRHQAAVAAGSHRPPGSGMIGTGRAMTRRVGTKGCACGAATMPGVVLDPFAGSFTTCLVAAKMGLGFIGIELNESYVAIGRKRLAPYMRPLSSFDEEAEA